MDGADFTFPDGLDVLTKKRLLLTDIPMGWWADVEHYTTRISDISFRKPGQMTFCLDGHKSGICHLTADETRWLDTGVLLPVQLAAHFAANRYTRFSRNPIQKTLFD